MALNSSTADACATAMVNTLASALGLTPAQKSAALTQWKIVVEQLYASLKTDIQINVTVTSVSGVTSGGASSGPGTGTGVAL